MTSRASQIVYLHKIGQNAILNDKFMDWLVMAERMHAFIFTSLMLGLLQKVDSSEFKLEI